MRAHRALFEDAVRQAGCIFHHGGRHIVPGHIEHGQRLDEHGFVIVLQQNFAARAHLGFRKNAVPRKQGDVLGIQEMRDCLSRGGQIQQSAPLRLAPPFFGIIVAIEENALVLPHRAPDQFHHGVAEILRAFQFVGELLELVGHDRVEHDVRLRDRRGGTNHAELKFVPREGEGRSAVAVRGILGEVRQHVHAHFHFHALFGVVSRAGLDGLQDAFQL